jgi:aryl-alcohol dehydrogenase-like predicted oxidoreductase
MVQSEYSMMERMFEADVIPLCRELGIGFVAFSPMASGFLSGKYTASMTYVGDDVRRAITRFAKENVIANQPLLDALEKLSQAKGCTKAQLALAWMLAKWPHVVPIPGMRSDARIEENLGATDVSLSPDELAEVEEALSHIVIHGNRTDEDIQRMGYVKPQ